MIAWYFLPATQPLLLTNPSLENAIDSIQTLIPFLRPNWERTRADANTLTVDQQCGKLR